MGKGRVHAVLSRFFFNTLPTPKTRRVRSQLAPGSWLLSLGRRCGPETGRDAQHVLRVCPAPHIPNPARYRARWLYRGHPSTFSAVGDGTGGILFFCFVLFSGSIFLQVAQVGCCRRANGKLELNGLEQHSLYWKIVEQKRTKLRTSAAIFILTREGHLTYRINKKQNKANLSPPKPMENKTAGTGAIT